MEQLPLEHLRQLLTFRVDGDFRGYVGFARAEGATLTRVTTFDSTTSVPTFPSIQSDDSNYYSATSMLSIFTVGAGFRLQRTDVPAPTDNTEITIGILPDINYNTTATLPAGARADANAAEQGQADGTIRLIIRGADGGLDGAQTNQLLGLSRNDPDYINEILDGSHTTDFISFDTTESTTVSSTVTFRKRDATAAETAAGTPVPQQQLQAIAGGADPISQNRDGFADVIIFPAATGLTPAGARIALEESTVSQKVSYLVSDGNAAPAREGRLVGIRPKGQNYTPGTDYITPTDTL